MIIIQALNLFASIKVQPGLVFVDFTSEDLPLSFHGPQTGENPCVIRNLRLVFQLKVAIVPLINKLLLACFTKLRSIILPHGFMVIHSVRVGRDGISCDGVSELIFLR